MGHQYSILEGKDVADKESNIEIESALGSQLSRGGWNYYWGHSQAFNKDSRSSLAPTPNHYIFVWGSIYNNVFVYKSISKRNGILKTCLYKVQQYIVLFFYQKNKKKQYIVLGLKWV